MTIIRLENLEFRYPGSEDPALKPVSLEIESGEAFALLGASGAGKTTPVSYTHLTLPTKA